MTEPSITCPRCGATSYNPNDIEQSYCGRCHWWTGDRLLGSPEVMAMVEDDGTLTAIYGSCEICGAPRTVRNVLVIRPDGEERYTRLVCMADPKGHSTD